MNPGHTRDLQFFSASQNQEQGQNISSEDRSNWCYITMVFLGANAHAVASSMLGAHILNHDVYETGLTAAVGSSVITTGGGSLVFANLPPDGSDSEYGIGNILLFVIGSCTYLYGTAFFPAVIGHLILHGGDLDHAESRAEMCQSSGAGTGVILGGIAGLSLIGLALCQMYEAMCVRDNGDTAQNESSNQSTAFRL